MIEYSCQMLPVLFSIGSVRVYTLAVFLGVGFFLSSFLIWRRLRELGLDEKKVVDFFLFLFFLAFVFARTGFIITHFQSFGFSLGRWLLVGRFPGLSFGSALLGAIFALMWFCRNNRWDFWRVADEVSFGFLPFVVLVQVGCFFDGCVLGKPTSLPWGMFFPGDFIRRQPVSLFGAMLFFLIWLFLLQIERHWRTWSWYKSKADGLVALFFWGLSFLAIFILAFLEEDNLYFLWFKKIGSLLGFLLMGIVFLRRAGIKAKQEKKE